MVDPSPTDGTLVPIGVFLWAAGGSLAIEVLTLFTLHRNKGIRGPSRLLQEASILGCTDRSDGYRWRADCCRGRYPVTSGD